MKKPIIPILIGAVVVIVIIGVAIGAHIHQSTNSSDDSQTNTASNSVSNTAGSNTADSNTTDTNSTQTSNATDNSSSTTSSCIGADQASSEIGSSECVQFTGYAYTSSRGEMYLDQSLSAPYGFSAYIPAGTSFGQSLLNEYSGKSVDVSGTITSYDGEPEIVVTSASQVQLAQ